MEHKGEVDMDQKTKDAMGQSQHDYLVVRICNNAYVNTHQRVQFISAGHRIRSFQTSFRDTWECCNHSNFRL